MGTIFSSLFGGSYKSTDMPTPTPAPLREQAKDPEAQAVRTEEQRRLRARRAMGGTILTSPLGVNSTALNSTLGR